MTARMEPTPLVAYVFPKDTAECARLEYDAMVRAEFAGREGRRAEMHLHRLVATLAGELRSIHTSLISVVDDVRSDLHDLAVRLESQGMHASVNSLGEIVSRSAPHDLDRRCIELNFARRTLARAIAAANDDAAER